MCMYMKLCLHARMRMKLCIEKDRQTIMSVSDECFVVIMWGTACEHSFFHKNMCMKLCIEKDRLTIMSVSDECLSHVNIASFT